MSTASEVSRAGVVRLPPLHLDAAVWQPVEDRLEARIVLGDVALRLEAWPDTSALPADAAITTAGSPAALEAAVAVAALTMAAGARRRPAAENAPPSATGPMTGPGADDVQRTIIGDQPYLVVGYAA